MPVGIGVVVPQEKILEVFEMPKLKAQRDEAKKARRQPLAARPDSAARRASPPANDANPTHREDFMRLVNAAARKPEPEG